MKTHYKDLDNQMKPIIKKMCQIVKVDPESIDYGKDGWYQKHTVTPKQEQSFLNWLEKYLITSKLCAKSLAKATANSLNLQFGWKTESIKTLRKKAKKI